jgi:hypothetical protein
VADDFDDRPRRGKKRSNDADATVKTFLLIFAGLAAVALLSCCGGVGYLYFLGQKMAKQIAMTNPAEIQALTAEMTDIVIPVEFVPRHGTSIFGIKTVSYEWCPGGNCPTRDDGLGVLLLASLSVNDGKNPVQNVDAFRAEEVSDESLKRGWRDYTKTEHDFTIRGRKCAFYIIQGEQMLRYDDEDADESDDQPPNGAPNGAEPDENDAPLKGGAPARGSRKAVRVSGSFPGKTAEVSLDLWLAPDDYREEQILGMLRSIR